MIAKPNPDKNLRVYVYYYGSVKIAPKKIDHQIIAPWKIAP